MMRFKEACSARWQPLAVAVAGELGEEVSRMVRDGMVTVDLVFPSYGQVCGIPMVELIESDGT